MFSGLELTFSLALNRLWWNVCALALRSSLSVFTGLFSKKFLSGIVLDIWYVLGAWAEIWYLDANAHQGLQLTLVNNCIVSIHVSLNCDAVSLLDTILTALLKHLTRAVQQLWPTVLHNAVLTCRCLLHTYACKTCKLVWFMTSVGEADVNRSIQPADNVTATQTLKSVWYATMTFIS